jgi:predicted ATPase/class 3 adenylate cyclase/Tfp pilus assembly protein PilF
MDTAQPETFGELLRCYRLAAGLSQEALAERARLSAQAVSALERGVKRTPYRETVRLLADALRLPAEEAARLEAAVPRRRGPPASVRPDVAPWLPPAASRLQADEPLPPSGVADPVALPTGTLTFLFTDIEGSTALWDCHPVAMQAALARHDALFEEVLARHGGRQVKERGEGDSIFAVFTSPSAALAAACALQQALLAEPWPPEAPLRVRMGLHTGEAALRGIGYYGVTVNRTARIRSLAHGGQILLSQATRDLLRDALPEGVGLPSLGHQVLKGLERPEEVFQVLHPHLPADFPPLPAPAAPTTNLPVQPTSFIGREREQAEVRALLGRSPLVTLTGAGGAGKTRLALALAAELVDRYPDGVWLVELAALAEPGLVPGAVAQALGVREEPGRPLLATLTDYLQERRLLLVLDNCEHLVEPCAELATALLRACPHLRLLATSREALEAAGERLYRVPSLAIADPDHLPPPEQLSQYEAVQLFLERAQARRADFTLTRQNARAVAQICARLDGLPLAIELAAARVSVLSVEGIAVRLDDRFRLLTGGPRTALPRQQTLRAALDWSHDLLAEPERVLLRRLGVFASGWTLEAAEAACAGEGVEAWEVLDLLGTLINKSLVLPEERDGEARYRLLETVRQYALERLQAAAEVVSTQHRHLRWCLALAEHAEVASRGPEERAWLDRLEREHSNLRTALTWSILDGGSPSTGAQLAAELQRFWSVRGHLSEGRRWLEEALVHATPQAAGIRLRVLNGVANLALAQADYDRATVLYEERLAVCRAQGDQAGIAVTLGNLGNVALEQGDFAQARELHEASLSLHQELGDQRGLAGALSSLGILTNDQGDNRRAGVLFERSLALYRALSDPLGIAASLNGLASVAWDQGDHARAGALYEECLSLCRDVGDQRGIANMLANLGSVAHVQGDHERGRALLEEGLALSRDLGNTADVARTLTSLGKVALSQGLPARAAALFRESLALNWELRARQDVVFSLEGLAGVAERAGQTARAAYLGEVATTLREALGMPHQPDERAPSDRDVAATRPAEPGLSLEEAIAYALEG